MAELPNKTSIYDLDYFSGSQMFLYVGDVWVDEVTQLQYRLDQSKRPIYGYASQLWDDCAAGQVMVQGAFTINYKEQGYLWAVLKRYFNMMASQTGIPGVKGSGSLLRKNKKLARDKDNKIIPGALDSRPLVGSNGTQISRASIERIIRGEVSTGERYKFWDGLAGYATTQVSDPKDKVFEDIMEVFEDQIWGQGVDNGVLNAQTRRTDDNKFDGFDMYVVFGNYANKKANHTVQKIIDVRLTSQGKMVNIDGQPVQEHYEFIAQTTA